MTIDYILKQEVRCILDPTDATSSFLRSSSELDITTNNHPAPFVRLGRIYTPTPEAELDRSFITRRVSCGWNTSPHQTTARRGIRPPGLAWPCPSQANRVGLHASQPRNPTRLRQCHPVSNNNGERSLLGRDLGSATPSGFALHQSRDAVYFGTLKASMILSNAQKYCTGLWNSA